MNIRLEMGEWVINDEYIIRDEVYRYKVYPCGTGEEEPKELYSSELFEECLTWIWNSI